MTPEVPEPPEVTVDSLSNEPVVVLLVDDQAIVGEAVRRMLAAEPDMNYHFCDDPREAVRLAGVLRPTVILQDLVMPGIDGLQLLRKYREDPSTGEIPVVVLSTKEDPRVEDRRRLPAPGAPRG